MLSFQIDTNSDEPLYEQIYNNIKKLILDGTYPNGSKLPSTRNMSVILNVSRNTVDTADYQLMSEGYIDSVPKSGFYVNDISLAHHTSDENSDNTENSASNNNDISEYDYDFSPFEVIPHIISGLSYVSLNLLKVHLAPLLTAHTATS